MIKRFKKYVYVLEYKVFGEGQWDLGEGLLGVYNNIHRLKKALYEHHIPSLIAGDQSEPAGCCFSVEDYGLVYTAETDKYFGFNRDKIASLSRPGDIKLNFYVQLKQVNSNR